jgi:hypothetical protein
MVFIQAIILNLLSHGWFKLSQVVTQVESKSGIGKKNMLKFLLPIAFVKDKLISTIPILYVGFMIVDLFHYSNYILKI